MKAEMFVPSSTSPELAVYLLCSVTLNIDIGGWFLMYWNVEEELHLIEKSRSSNKSISIPDIQLFLLSQHKKRRKRRNWSRETIRGKMSEFVAFKLFLSVNFDWISVADGSSDFSPKELLRLWIIFVVARLSLVLQFSLVFMDSQK